MLQVKSARCVFAICELVAPQAKNATLCCGLAAQVGRKANRGTHAGAGEPH